MECINLQDKVQHPPEEVQHKVSASVSDEVYRPIESNNNEINEIAEENSDLNCEEFDNILEIIGPRGRFQKLLLYAIIFPITMIEPLITLNTIFLFYQPDHWCQGSGVNQGRNNTDLDTWKALHIPLDYERPADANGHIKYSQCTMFSTNRSIIKCDSWDYEKTEYESTIATEYNWVCEDTDNPTQAFTSQALGNAIGTLIFGHLADKVGRKPIFFLTIFINVLFRLISFFVVQNIKMFLLMQFLVGTGFPIMFIAPSMIIAEICDKDYRGWVYAVIWIIWVVGMAALPLVVWACRYWFITGLATTLPGLAIFLYWFHLPESPRWLLSVGRIEESSKILLEIAECNKRSERFTKSQLDTTLKRLYEKQDKTEGSLGVWTLFSHRRLAKNTLLLTFCWSINIVVYYGLTLNTTHMSGSTFVNFFLLSIIELPSGMAGAYLVDKVGRRWTQVFFFSCCTLSCISAALVVQYLNHTVLEIVTVIVAKFSVTLTFLVVYLQGAEIFPTQLRSTGSGFASTIGAVCGILGPIMVALGTYHLSYPYFIMGGLCILGMISAAFLPETLNQHLPESVEEANNFGNKFWSFIPKPSTVSEPVVINRVTRTSENCIQNLTNNHLNKVEIT